MDDVANLTDVSGDHHADAIGPQFSRHLVEDLGRVRPPGAGLAGEGGSTGKENYEGSGGGSPAGNSDIRAYRVTARSTGGLATVVRVVESVYAGRAKG